MQRLDKEKKNIEDCIMQERSFMQESIMAMAAWEQQLDQRTRELAIRTSQFTPETSRFGKGDAIEGRSVKKNYKDYQVD